MRRAVVLGALVAVAAALPSRSLAHAQSAVENRARPPGAPTSDVSAHEAKKRYLRGMELALRGNWSAALAEFNASRELHPTGAAGTNAAFCLRQLGRPADALELYELVLRDHGASLTNDERRAIELAISQLGLAVARIEVRTAVPGAVVLLDGQEKAATPLAAPLRVNPGLHVVRVLKTGYEPLQRSLTVASGQTKVWSARMLQLSAAGLLQVRELGGKALDVLVDGARVGVTPWQGLLPIGSHTVALRGRGVGTPPVNAELRGGQLTKLTLRAIVLDAELRIEPRPLSASLELDGVKLGAGVWQGAVPSGPHDLAASADGFASTRQRIRVRPGSQRMELVLERQARKSARFMLELSGGAGLSPSLGGGAQASCDAGRRSLETCASRPLPLGLLATVRGGYRVTPRIGLEVFVGYTRLWQDLERRVRVTDASGEAFISDRVLDQTRVSTPLAGFGVSRRFFERTPLVLRLSTGLGRSRVQTAVSGIFVREQGAPDAFPFSLLESARSLWVPFLAPEVRFGYRLAPRWAVDAGVGAWLFLPPSYPRRSLAAVPEDREARWLPLAGTRAVAGPIRLPIESALGTHMLFALSLGVRLDL